MKNIVVLLAILGSISSLAQTIEWEMNYGGSSADELKAIQATPDGGYLLGGHSSSNNGDISGNNGGTDVWIVKIDENGVIEWEKNYGGSAFDALTDISSTNDGGFLLGCYSQSSDGDVGGNNGDEDYWLVKIDALGNIQWEKNYGGSDFDKLHVIESTNDGGYVLGGFSYSLDGDVQSGNYGNNDYWLVKIDAFGNVQWEQHYGGSNTDLLNDVKQTSDGGYILAGTARSIDFDVNNNHSVQEFWIVKTDALGNLQWEKSFGGTGSDELEAILLTVDGGFLLGGYTFSSPSGDVLDNYGNHDYWLVKTDALGNIEWSQNYGGTNWEQLTTLKPSADGGYLLGGYSTSNNIDVSDNYGSRDYWIVKTNELGNIVWERNHGGSSNDELYDIEETDGEVLLAGTTWSFNGEVSNNNGFKDFWVVKLYNDADNFCNPHPQITAETGDIQVEDPCYGAILTAPDSTRFRITAQNDGSFTTETLDSSLCQANLQLTAESGDAYIDNACYGLVLASLDSSKYRMKVDNGGFFNTEKVLIPNAPPQLEWSQNYGAGGREYLTRVKPTSDGGYIIGGLSTSGSLVGNGQADDYWVVKTDALGNIEWEQDYGGSNYEQLHDLQQTVDGGYILAGWSQSSNGDVSNHYGGGDYWVVKTDALGNIEWEKNYGGNSIEWLWTIEPTSDGGFIFGGESFTSANGDVSNSSNGSSDYWVVKTDALGNIEWEKNYGGSDTDILKDIRQTNDGGYILGGWSYSDDGDVSGNNGQWDYWVIKTDALGNIEWEQNYGRVFDEYLMEIKPTSDNGYIAGGTILGTGLIRTFWVVKLDALGNIEWEKFYGDFTTDQAMSSVIETNDGGYVLGGIDYDEESFWVVKIDADGMVEWDAYYLGRSSLFNTDMELTLDGGLILGGLSYTSNLDMNDNSNGLEDYWIVKLSSIQANPQCDLHPQASAQQGDLFIDQSCYGIIMTAPDSSCYRLKVLNDGALITEPVTCPQ